MKTTKSIPITFPLWSMIIGAWVQFLYPNAISSVFIYIALAFCVFMYVGMAVMIQLSLSKTPFTLKDFLKIKKPVAKKNIAWKIAAILSFSYIYLSGGYTGFLAFLVIVYVIINFLMVLREVASLR